MIRTEGKAQHNLPMQTAAYFNDVSPPLYFRTLWRYKNCIIIFFMCVFLCAASCIINDDDYYVLHVFKNKKHSTNKNIKTCFNRY